MKRFYFTLIALIATLVASAQKIEVYEYDANGNLSSTPAYTSSKQVKVVFKPTHEYVDLGLPSGTLWATCNVGAEKPEDYGDYFAWGETKPKSYYGWESYKHQQSDYLTKYCYRSNYGTVDNKMELDPEDDAASANWGSSWCMPTKDQLKELFNSDYTTAKGATQNGVYGYKITSKKNGKSLFLPAAGGYEDGKLVADGLVGCYWSRSLTMEIYTYKASVIVFDPLASYTNEYERSNGFSVRPVRVKK